jgi:hypothetical protein
VPVHFTRDEHLEKSQRNEQFARTIDTSSVAGLEWAITVKFYAGLHFIQAYFASRTGRVPITHDNRSTSIHKDAMISGAYDDYRELKDMSRAARYDCETLQSGHLKFADECLASVKSIVGLHL